MIKKPFYTFLFPIQIKYYIIDYTTRRAHKQNGKRNTKLREALLTAMGNAVDEVRKWPQKEVQIFHHNDSDGLTSGAILKTAFESGKHTNMCGLQYHNKDWMSKLVLAPIASILQNLI